MGNKRKPYDVRLRRFRMANSPEFKQKLQDARTSMQQKDKSVVQSIRYANDSNERQNWNDRYNDYGVITWSTSSKKNTPERRQEKKTFKKLAQNTGLNFQRVGRGSGEHDIHIKRFGNNRKYFEKNYGDQEWNKNYQEATGGQQPGGLHHFKSRPDGEGGGNLQ